jgi:hypothetical protein
MPSEVHKIHVAMHASRAALPNFQNFCPKTAIPTLPKCHHNGTKHKFQPKYSTFAYSQQPMSHQPSFFTSQSFTLLASSLPLPEG